jgi:hypothetical protein
MHYAKPIGASANLEQTVELPSSDLLSALTRSLRTLKRLPRNALVQTAGKRRSRSWSSLNQAQCVVLQQPGYYVMIDCCRCECDRTLSHMRASVRCPMMIGATLLRAYERSSLQRRLKAGTLGYETKSLLTSQWLNSL